MPATPRTQICAGCRQGISGQFIGCAAPTCAKVYDLACVAPDGISSSETKIWICPECRANRRKTGDPSTPVRSTPPVSIENITLRKKTTPKTVDSSLPPVGDDLSTLAKEIRAMRLTINIFRDDFSSRLDNIATSLLETGQRIDALESKQEKLEGRNTDLEITVRALEERIALMSQQALKNEVEILGVQEVKGELPVHLALVAAKKIGISMSCSDIEDATRVGIRRGPGVNNDNGLPRPLVVRFAKKTMRDDFLKEARSRRTLNSKDVAGQGPERQVYVNERLTAANRQLFRSAKERSSECGYKHCWVRNGCIFVRRKDGGPMLRISAAKDLTLLSRTNDGQNN